MRLHTDDALILRTYRYGEADRIIVFLTEDRGKRRGVAKNASASRRRFGAALEPLTRGRVAYVEREGRELVRVDRIEPSVSPMRAAETRGDEAAPQVLATAAYFAELIDEWAPESSPNERLFRLGTSVADALALDGDLEALTRYFEYWVLRLEGVYPSLEACPRCGHGTFDRGAVFVTTDRAYVCVDCGGSPNRLSAGAVGFLRSAGRQSPEEAARASGSVEALRELERVHRLLIAVHLEHEVRSARIVKELRLDS